MAPCPPMQTLMARGDTSTRLWCHSLKDFIMALITSRACREDYRPGQNHTKSPKWHIAGRARRPKKNGKKLSDSGWSLGHPGVITMKLGRWQRTTLLHKKRCLLQCHPGVITMKLGRRQRTVVLHRERSLVQCHPRVITTKPGKRQHTTLLHKTQCLLQCHNPSSHSNIPRRCPYPMAAATPTYGPRMTTRWRRHISVPVAVGRNGGQAHRCQ